MPNVDDPFVRSVLGRIVHVTSVNGFRRIQSDKCIRPSAGNLESRWRSGLSYCQSIDAVSVLDLKNADREILFGEGWIQNWHGVFTYHAPAIVLVMSLGEDEQKLLPCELGCKGKAIIGVEKCFPGNIPVTSIENILITYGSTKRFIDTGTNNLSEELLTHLRFAAEMAEDAKPKFLG